MKLTRRQVFAGLLAPVVAPKLLEAAKALPLSKAAIQQATQRYASDTFYRMGAEFTGDHPYKLTDSHALMLHLCANVLHRKVLDAAEGRRVIWCAPMELHGFVDWEWTGPIGPVPRCRHLVAWDGIEARWIHHLDVEVAFTDRKSPSGTRYFDGPKIGDTLYVRRPVRHYANEQA